MVPVASAINPMETVVSESRLVVEGSENVSLLLFLLLPGLEEGSRKHETCGGVGASAVAHHQVLGGLGPALHRDLTGISPPRIQMHYFSYSEGTEMLL